MPYDVAFYLPDTHVSAYGIIFNGFEGGEFDFNRWQFVERK